MHKLLTYKVRAPIIDRCGVDVLICPMFFFISRYKSCNFSPIKHCAGSVWMHSCHNFSFYPNPAIHAMSKVFSACGNSQNFLVSNFAPFKIFQEETPL